MTVENQSCEELSIQEMVPFWQKIDNLINLK